MKLIKGGYYRINYDFGKDYIKLLHVQVITTADDGIFQAVDIKGSERGYNKNRIVSIDKITQEEYIGARDRMRSKSDTDGVH